MSILDQFKQIRTFIFDMDGTLTDGGLMILDNGQFIRRMHIRDGFAIHMAVKKGYRIAVISGSTSEPAVLRFKQLGINDIYMGIADKKAKLLEYATEHQLSLKEILFMGDDIPDYEPMKIVGMPCAPADAAPEIMQVARYISPVTGGNGCVRDVIEKVLKLNGHWEVQTDVRSS